MKSRSRRLRTQRGHTLAEIVVATGLLVLMLAFGLPAFQSVGDAGGEGSAQITAQAENQSALLSIAAELQNTSSDAEDEFGNPRLQISNGEAPTPLWDHRDKGLGGFKGKLGNFFPGYDPYTGNGEYTQSGSYGEATNQVSNTGEENFITGYAGRGSGTRGGSRLGRERSSKAGGAAGFGGAAVRPRFADIQTNSVLTFQKVVGYALGADGAPVVSWSQPVTFQVENNKLVRIENGQTRVIAPFVVGFRAAVTDAGTVVITVVNQKRNNSNSRIMYQANQIEVSPKN